MSKITVNEVDKKIEVDLISLAVKLAFCDDEEQGKFFNAFAIALEGCCGSRYRAEMQSCYANNYIDQNNKYVFEKLGYHE